MTYKNLSAAYTKFGTFVEIVVIAGVLALAVNLLSTGIVAFAGFSSLEAISSGVGLTLAGLTFLLVKVRRSLNHDQILDGAIVWPAKAAHCVALPDYEFSEGITEYFKSARVEDQDLAAELERLASNDEDDDDRHRLRDERIAKLINEASKYFILSRLATHLTDFFNTDRKSDRFVRISREEISDLVATNRFLYLFSKPMKERKHFSDQPPSKPHEIVILAHSTSGALFEHFDFALPRGSRMTRLSSGSFALQTSGFKITVHCECGGFGAVLPFDYMRSILNVDPMTASCYSVPIRISTRIHWRAFLLLGRRQQYNWLDSFLEALHGELSIDGYFKRIGWASTSILLRVLGSSRQTGRSKARV